MLDKPVSKKTVPLPHRFGDVVHIDIGYGCNSGLDGIKYALFAVDRAARHKYIFPMRSLKDDILPSMHQLITEMGCTPKKIITNFVRGEMGSQR